jgi:hypothetical protein
VGNWSRKPVAAVKVSVPRLVLKDTVVPPAVAATRTVCSAVARAVPLAYCALCSARALAYTVAGSDGVVPDFTKAVGVLMSRVLL